MQETIKPKRKQITFDISAEHHNWIKSNAALRNISMNLWIKRAIQKEIDFQNQYTKLPKTAAVVTEIK